MSKSNTHDSTSRLTAEEETSACPASQSHTLGFRPGKWYAAPVYFDNDGDDEDEDDEEDALRATLPTFAITLLSSSGNQPTEMTDLQVLREMGRVVQDWNNRQLGDADTNGIEDYESPFVHALSQCNTHDSSIVLLDEPLPFSEAIAHGLQSISLDPRVFDQLEVEDQKRFQEGTFYVIPSTIVHDAENSVAEHSDSPEIIRYYSSKSGSQSGTNVTRLFKPRFYTDVDKDLFRSQGYPVSRDMFKCYQIADEWTTNQLKDDERPQYKQRPIFEDCGKSYASQIKSKVTKNSVLKFKKGGDGVEEDLRSRGFRLMSEEEIAVFDER